jgi:hypothetical protein
MKNFVLKTLLFALVAAGIFQLKSQLMMRKDKYQKKVLGAEVYFSIEKSKKKNKARKVLLGDSVGKQLFDSSQENDTVNSLTSNQAIGMAGQYILLDNYLKAGNEIDTAYVFFTPFSFVNNLDQIFTYNYFVKPFYREQYMSLIEPVAKAQIEKIPFVGLAHYPAVLTSNWSPEFESQDKNDFNLISPVSAAYLHKMSALAKQHHFKLVLVAAPVSLKKRRDVEILNRQEIETNHLQEEFKGFFESIVWLDESNFKDGTHLKHPEKFKYRYKNLIR